MKSIRTKGWMGILLIWGLMGCDNDVVPYQSDPDRYFAISGYLDTTQNVQVLRVEPYRFYDGTPRFTAIRAFTSDLQGQQIMWRDTLFALDNGGQGHGFTARFIPKAGETYTFAVEDAQGHRTTALITMPKSPSLTFAAPYKDGRGYYMQPYLGQRILEPYDARVRYTVSKSPHDEAKEVMVDYTRNGRFLNGEWAGELSLNLDMSKIKKALELSPEIQFFSVQMDLVQLDDQWRTMLYTPNKSFSNVSNGTGFVGAKTFTSHTWRLSTDVVTYLGMTDRQ